jgi:alpha-ketoglutarate-dependent taurine dioxygenase
MRLETTDLTPRIGTRIHADLGTLLSGSAAAEIRALLEQRGVIVVRGLDLDDAQQVAFSRTLGSVMELDGDAVFEVTLDEKQNPEYAEYNFGNFSWHMDRTDLDVPNLSSILRPKKLSPSGGQTQFANTYAAYDDLPEPVKRSLDGLRVVHRVESSFRESIRNPTEEQLARWRSHPPRVHPLVWHHRSGRTSLALSTSASEVVGMDREEGEALLRRLMARATQPEYVYTHSWEMGDLVFWDNTGTMHRVLPYDPGCGRCMHRTTLAGEEPLSAGGISSS